MSNPFTTTEADQNLWRWGELAAQFAELGRRERQHRKNRRLALWLLGYHTIVGGLLVLGCRPLVDWLGPLFGLLLCGHWGLLWWARAGVIKQGWWQVR